MAKSKQIRRALVSSLTTLVLCVAMLVGSTYAWFSNNATVAVSKIQTSNYEVKAKMRTVSNGEATWVDIEDTIKFDNDEALTPDNPKSLTLRVVNEGDLPVQYKLLFTGYSDTGELAESLEVQVQEGEEKARNAGGSVLLSEILDFDDGVFTSGTLAAKPEDGDDSADNISDEITLTLSVPEGTDDAYQSLSITGLAITLSATQCDENAVYAPSSQTVTLGSMPNVYVQMANSDPAAAVYSLDGEEAEQPTVEAFDFGGVCSFRSLDDLDGENPYADYHADVVITADGDMEAQSLLIAAYSELFCDGDWLGWMNDAAVEAGEEIRLMQALWGDDAVVSYAELFENDAKLKCALSDLGEGDSANTGTTVKVELRLYEIDDEAETGEYLTIGNYEYTF